MAAQVSGVTCICDTKPLYCYIYLYMQHQTELTDVAQEHLWDCISLEMGAGLPLCNCWKQIHSQ